MKIGDRVYLITDQSQAGAGVPGRLPMFTEHIGLVDEVIALVIWPSSLLDPRKYRTARKQKRQTRDAHDRDCLFMRHVA